LSAALALPTGSWREALLEQVAGAIAGGVDVVQVREGDLDSGPYLALLRRIVDLTAGTQVKVIVNDRLDLALAAGAHGVHLKESGIAVAAARRLIGAAFTVGQSVHTTDTAQRARGADYVIAGSVFATESKRGAASSLGLDGLQRIVAAAQPCPVWAVGGISISTARQVLASGASGIAAIGAFIPPHLTEKIASDVENATRRLRFCFDSALELS
jgi:thiamine-phosphate diphosphorylase